MAATASELNQLLPAGFCTGTVRPTTAEPSLSLLRLSTSRPQHLLLGHRRVAAESLSRPQPEKYGFGLVWKRSRTAPHLDRGGLRPGIVRPLCRGQFREGSR